jgi:hypothetical protein
LTRLTTPDVCDREFPPGAPALALSRQSWRSSAVLTNGREGLGSYGRRGLSAVADPELPRPASAIYGSPLVVLRESAEQGRWQRTLQDQRALARVKLGVDPG